MTVRMAELLTAVFMALASIAIMIKSTDGLQIGWVTGAGPGSGFWPFYLALGMLLTSLAIAVRGFMGVTPQSRSTEPIMDGEAARLLGTTVAALFLLILGMAYISTYLALMLFLFFYLKVMGKHTWFLTILLVILIPVALFLFFEMALQIPLPKGQGVFAELYYPIYALIY